MARWNINDVPSHTKAVSGSVPDFMISAIIALSNLLSEAQTQLHR